MARIELQAAYCRAEKGRSLEPTTLSVRRGACLALVGPLGSGAPQLAQMMAGKAACVGGQILLDGKNVSAAELADQVGWIGIGAPTANAGAKVSWWQRMRGIGLADQPGAQTEALGIQVKAQLEEAFAAPPKVLVLDGCLGLLDPQSKNLFGEALRQNHDMSVVLVSPDPLDAMVFADQVAVMQSGTVEQMGAPQDIYDQPRTSFVAGYFGAPPMNLIAGTLSGGVFRAENIQVEGVSGPDGPAVLGFRPEDALWLEEEMGFTGCEISAAVDAVAPMGNWALLHMRSGEVPVRIRVPKTASVAVGSLQRAILPPEICLLFHPTSGELLDGDGLRLSARV